MGFDKFKDKITGALSGHGDKVDDGIDKAKDFVDDKTGGKYSDKLDTGAEKAKEYADRFDDDAEQGGDSHPREDGDQPR